MTAVTTQQVSRGLASLESWTDKLLAQCGDQAGRIGAFLESINFADYWKYYKELVPYVRQFARQTDNEEIKRLSAKICDENVQRMEQAMKPAPGTFWSFLKWDDPSAATQGMDEFNSALRQIQDDTRNLIYQLKILD